MEDTKIKCPHCGAQKVEHLGLNQYQCQYCGHTFIVGRENEFSEESRKAFQINQNEERKKEWTKAKLKKIRDVAILTLVSFVLGIVVVISMEYYKDHFVDNQYYYSARKVITNLEDGAFTNESETVEFMDYARSVKINGKVLDCKVYGRNQKYSTNAIVAINSVEYELCYDADSTYVFLRHAKTKETWVKRPTRNEKPREIFSFKSEDQLRECLLKAPFKFHEETIQFTDHGYSVVINGEKFEIKETHLCNDDRVDLKAILTFASTSVKIYTDERGNNIYIKYHEKKYTR